MKIKEGFLRVRDLTEGYIDNNEDGVVGYYGNLNIRPKYQREYVYNDKQREAVIQSIMNDLPLSIMYWADNEDGTYELLDGQQRTISICQYVNGDFSINYKYFHNLEKCEKEKLLDYELMIFICEGTNKERLEWFQTINIATTQLTKQELRNAVYTGEWLNDAKRYFSKTGCPAYQLSSDCLKGVAIRQELLETALKWIACRDNVELEEYMAIHQHDKDASELWEYFSDIINWVKTLFPNPIKELKTINWGKYYNDYKNVHFTRREIDEKLKQLKQDEDVTSTKGIYEYIIDGNEKHLSIRTFDNRTKRIVYEKQNKKCIHCQNEFDLGKMQADHITPWSKGGKTIIENCQLLCEDCNRKKSNK